VKYRTMVCSLLLYMCLHSGRKTVMRFQLRPMGENATRTADNVCELMEEGVESGATVHTDSLASYNRYVSAFCFTLWLQIAAKLSAFDCQSQ